MRKLGLIISAICVFLTQQASAQVNPQTGYVITNNGDTIHGTIDYLTDAKNARTCLFRKNGESEFVAYTPDDIRAYRLANDGIYYVSRMFEADGKSTPLFAEFLIQGGVSLYRYNVDGCNYYQFVGNDGKTAMLKDDGLTADDTSYREKLQERRGRLQDVMQILYKSPNLLKRLWKTDLSPENVTDIIKQYDEEFCTE